MTKNDTFFKIIFAIQIALLPIVIASSLFNMPTWATCLIIGGVVLSKIWVELFKDKHNLLHKTLNGVGTVLTFAVLLAFFASKDILKLWLVIVAGVLIVLYSLISVLLKKEAMPEIVEAIDYCFMMFECLTLVAFCFAFYNEMMANIGLFALILSAGVSFAYKVYHAIKYKSLFRK